MFIDEIEGIINISIDYKLDILIKSLVNIDCFSLSTGVYIKLEVVYS